MPEIDALRDRTDWPVLNTLGVRFEPDARMLRHGGRTRCLAPREAAVLLALLEDGVDEVVTRTSLLEAIWHDQDVGEETITLTISRLRRHFTLLGVTPDVIQTVHRSGYRLRVDQGQAPLLQARRRVGDGERRPVDLALTVAALALALSMAALLLHLVR
jgi:DNA-binding winged helix-turn-helix (wHTH) protein